MKSSPHSPRVARQQNPFAAPKPSLERHRRKCVVCNHPERDAIEEAFVQWRSPFYITNAFELEDHRALYRHAHATGLYEQRRRNYLFTIENILERGEEIELTAAAYIKAVRAYACLCDTVRWNEPVTRVTYEYNVRTEPPAREEGAAPAPSPSLQTLESDSSAPAPRPDQKPRITDSVAIQRASRQTSPTARSENSAKVPAHAGSASSDYSDEKFLAAAIPLLGATPKTAAQLKKAGLFHLAELASRHLRPASQVQGRVPPNRHNAELEIDVSPRKQSSEVNSNRHKITK